MPAPFTDNANATWSTISGPVDGDPPTAASVRSPLQDLIDRTAKIKSGADRKSTRLNSSHVSESRMPSSA